jgi:hypothetical protein
MTDDDQLADVDKHLQYLRDELASERFWRKLIAGVLTALFVVVLGFGAFAIVTAVQGNHQTHDISRVVGTINERGQTIADVLASIQCATHPLETSVRISTGSHSKTFKCPPPTPGPKIDVDGANRALALIPGLKAELDALFACQNTPVDQPCVKP